MNWKPAVRFFRNLHPITSTLILVLTVSVPITLVSSALEKGVNRENLAASVDYFKNNKLSKIAFETLVEAPFKEKLKHRGPIAAVTLLRNFRWARWLITLENPFIFLLVIFPGVQWAETHTNYWAALFDSVLYGLLVFKIGGLRGWLSSWGVHVIVNFAVFIGFSVNLLIK